MGSKLKSYEDRWANGRLSFEPNTGCWLWAGYVCRDGYGRCARTGFLGEELAHRASYIEHVGIIPHDYEIDHLCRQRCCVNPQHLEAVPHSTNVERGDYTSNHRNGRKTHCKRGHSLEGGNLRIAVSGARQCRTCVADRQREKAGGPKGYHGPASCVLYCRHGHPMFGKDLRFKGGKRYCPVCANASRRKCRKTA